MRASRRCYSAAPEGGTSAYETRSATGGDFDYIVGVAVVESLRSERSIVVRYIDGDEARVICTVVAGEVIWPRLASPPRPASELFN